MFLRIAFVIVVSIAWCTDVGCKLPVACEQSGDEAKIVLIVEFHAGQDSQRISHSSRAHLCAGGGSAIAAAAAAAADEQHNCGLVSGGCGSGCGRSGGAISG